MPKTTILAPEKKQTLSPESSGGKRSSQGISLEEPKGQIPTLSQEQGLKVPSPVENQPTVSNDEINAKAAKNNLRKSTHSIDKSDKSTEQ